MNYTKLGCALFIVSLVLPLSDRAHAGYTISGISSGGFMAAQMGVIYSDSISGVGTVAGGVYFCAKDHFPIEYNQTQGQGLFDFVVNQSEVQSPFVMLTKGIQAYVKNFYAPAPDNPLYLATQTCMVDPRLALSVDETSPMDLSFVSEFYSQGLIADPSNIQAQHIYVEQGANDNTVGVSMMDKMNEFYTRLGVPSQNLVLDKTDGGHNFPTNKNGELGCDQEKVPFVASCGNDVAGKILSQLSSSPAAFASPSTYNESNLYKINQTTLLYTNSVAPYGYLYAPPECLQSPGSCRLHVALHGCEMSDDYDDAFETMYEAKLMSYGVLNVTAQDSPMDTMVGNSENLSALPLSIQDRVRRMGALRFALDSGYGEYAETNHLMILFPQTQITSQNYPENPKGCWDWYGWTTTDSVKTQGNDAGKLYATQKGLEARWLNQLANQIQSNPSAFLLPWDNKANDVATARSQ